jgi:CheY-like chemotaxis protein
MTGPRLHRPLRKIVHIDDDPVLRDIVRRALGKSPFPVEIKSCSSAKDALDIIPSFAPDLLLVDCIMPEMGGVEMVQNLRADTDSPYRDIPVILISGKVENVLSAQEQSLGILGLIRKPFPIAAFPSLILDLWNSGDARDDRGSAPANSVSRA